MGIALGKPDLSVKKLWVLTTGWGTILFQSLDAKLERLVRAKSMRSSPGKAALVRGRQYRQ